MCVCMWFMNMSILNTWVLAIAMSREGAYVSTDWKYTWLIIISDGNCKSAWIHAHLRSTCRDINKEILTPFNRTIIHCTSGHAQKLLVVCRIEGKLGTQGAIILANQGWAISRCHDEDYTSVKLLTVHHLSTGSDWWTFGYCDGCATESNCSSCKSYWLWLS